MEEVKKNLMRGGEVIAKEGEKMLPVVLTNIAVALVSRYISRQGI